MTHRLIRTTLLTAPLALLVGFALSLPAVAKEEPAPLPPPQKAAETPSEASDGQVIQSHATPGNFPPRAVDLVVCLDTSGSMDGLIDSTRQKLWRIVNDLALAKPTPALRVSLVSYGNDKNAEADGWVRVETPLTSDLDTVSAKLFALTTDGGTELVGRAVDTALTKLEWSPDSNALKMVVIAGNESADQDTEVSFRDACKRSIESDVVVNAIYCQRNEDASIEAGWAEVARAADGHFARIDADEGTVVIDTPFDAQLADLSTALNGTYVPLGELGRIGCSNQWAQDGNAQRMNGSNVAERALSKRSKLYVCDWDLVTAWTDDKVKLADVKKEDLPEALRELSVVELEAHLKAKLAEREKLQAQMGELGTKRQAFIDAKLAGESLDESDAFDHVVRRAIRAQARAKGFEFPGDADETVLGEATGNRRGR